MNIQKYLIDYAEKVNPYNPAVSLTYQNNSEHSKTFNFGSMNESGSKVHDNSLFQIGSLSKSYLAVVVLQLDAEGMLNIEETVGTYLAEFPFWKDIALKKLLNMTSGVRNFLDIHERDIPLVFKIIKDNPLHRFTYDDLLNLVKNEPVNIENKFHYCSTNYVLLGKIIEKVTKKSLKCLVYERIIRPLNLKNTFYIEHLARKEIPHNQLLHLVEGYYIFPEIKNLIFQEGTKVSNYTQSASIAGGSIISTSQEVNFYLRALFSGKLISASQLYKFLTPIDVKTGKELSNGVNIAHPNGYALGIEICYDSCLDENIYFHSGGVLGYTSYMYYFSKSKISFTTFFNICGLSPSLFANFEQEFPKHIVTALKSALNS